MPAPQRVNRALYGLALASMLVLLVEIGIGGRSSDVDLAGEGGAPTLRGPTSTTPLATATSVAPGPEPATPGVVSLADIVAQVITSPAAEDGSSLRRAPATTSPAARAAQPVTGGAGGGSGGGGSGGGGSSPTGGGSTPAAGAPAPAPKPGPSTAPPSTAATTPTTRPARTVTTLELPRFDFPDRTVTTRRDRR